MVTPVRSDMDGLIPTKCGFTVGVSPKRQERNGIRSSLFGYHTIDRQNDSVFILRTGEDPAPRLVQRVGSPRPSSLFPLVTSEVVDRSNQTWSVYGQWIQSLQCKSYFA